MYDVVLGRKALQVEWEIKILFSYFPMEEQSSWSFVHEKREGWN